MAEGKVTLVGAGPGDAGLLTLRGKAALEAADVVVFDRLVGGGVLAMIPPTARTIDVGKNAGNHPVVQEEINAILLREALAGNAVVRLKGGDPFVFGRGGEELELLAEYCIPFEVVPGITSALSAAAYAGIPVTHRDCCSSVHIITAHRRAGADEGVDYASIAKAGGTLVFLMGVSEIPNICDGLLEGGMDADTPAAIVERGTTACQRRIDGTLSSLARRAAEEKVASPAVVIVGGVAALAEKFAWREKLPLFGARTIVTRTRKQASRLSALLRDLGAEVLEAPAIEIIPIEQSEEITAALERLCTYDAVLFTSVNGVELFFAQLKKHRLDIRALGGAKLGAIGSATKEALEERGLLVDILPETYDAYHLGEAVAAALPKGSRVLTLRAQEGSDGLNNALDKAGIALNDVALYRTETGIADPTAVHFWVQEAIAAHTQLYAAQTQLYAAQTQLYAAQTQLYAALGSASCARGLAAALSDEEKNVVTAVCIGEQTAVAARECGFTRITVAKQATLGDLADAVVEAHWNLRKQ